MRARSARQSADEDGPELDGSGGAGYSHACGRELYTAVTGEGGAVTPRTNPRCVYAFAGDRHGGACIVGDSIALVSTEEI